MSAIAPPRDCPACGRAETLWHTYRLFEETNGPEVGCGQCGHVEKLARRPAAVSFTVDLDGTIVDKTPKESPKIPKRR